MTFELDCWEYIKSCINSPDLIAIGETVFIYTKDGQFTDTGYLGYVEATVTQAYKDCDHYSYAFDLVGDLPAGVAKLSKCDILTISCAEASLPITLTAGRCNGDLSGGSIQLNPGDDVNLCSSDGSVCITISEGNIDFRSYSPAEYDLNCNVDFELPIL